MAWVQGGVEGWEGACVGSGIWETRCAGSLGGSSRVGGGLGLGFVPFQPPGLPLLHLPHSYGGSIFPLSVFAPLPIFSARLWGPGREEGEGLPSLSLSALSPYWGPQPHFPSQCSGHLPFFPSVFSFLIPLLADMAHLLSHAPCRQLARWAGACRAVNRALRFCAGLCVCRISVF